MARVTYGSGITELAGSIGGITYQKNASGNIAKLRSNPIVNPSALQASAQNNLSKLVAYFPTLSQSDKDDWNTLAAAHDHTTPWGETKSLSGYQWFLSINLTHLLQYSTFIDSPYSFYSPPPPDQFIIEISSTYIRAAWSPAYNAPYDIIAYCSLPLRQSSIKLRRSLFYIDKYITAPTIDNWDLTTVIEALFNVTWADFYASADCSIIIRLISAQLSRGWRSSFTSAIIKI